MNQKIKNQQNIILGSLFAFLGMICLVILNLLMPKVPTPTPIPQKQTTVADKFIGTVTLDAGHGGYDDGSIGQNNELEKEITLSITKKVQAILEKQHVQVIMTRTSDEVSWPSDNVKDLDARLKIAQDSHSKFIVSIHCNSSDEEPDYTTGSEVYANAAQSDSMDLAQTINAQLQTLSKQMPSRGVKSDLDLHMLMFNKIPSVIVETGFISHEGDLKYLKNETGQQQLAQAIANGILEELKK